MADSCPYAKLQAEITRALLENNRSALRRLLRDRQTLSARKGVKVLVLGDDGVGKSSLICTLISNHFSEAEQMPDVYTDVAIPEDSFWENKVTVTIVDSSQNTSTEDLTLKVLEADSLVLVYDATRRETLEHLATHWLPFITQLTRAPVIVAGNKADVRTGQGLPGGGGGGLGGDWDPAQDMLPLVEQFGDSIWACYECSAKSHSGVFDVFYMAQHVVVHPVEPLFDLGKSKLTRKFETAMARIFRHFDQDCDGLLCPRELNQFQFQCFGVGLSDNEMAGLFKLVALECPDRQAPPRTASGGRRGGESSTTAAADLSDLSSAAASVPCEEELVGIRETPSGAGPGVTLRGFLAIFRVFVLKHKFEVPWMVLRLFGYGDDVELTPETLEQLSVVFPDPGRRGMELSASAERFLGRVFHHFAVIVPPPPQTALIPEAAPGEGEHPMHLASAAVGAAASHHPLPESPVPPLNKEKVLTASALRGVFSVVPEGEAGRTPWDPKAWEGYWTTPWLPNAPLPAQLAAQPAEERSDPDASGSESSAASSERGSPSRGGGPGGGPVVGGMTRRGWLNAWRVCAALHPHQTQRFLGYLGFATQDLGLLGRPPAQAAQAAQDFSELEDTSSAGPVLGPSGGAAGAESGGFALLPWAVRGAAHALVLGSPGCGKTALLAALGEAAFLGDMQAAQQGNRAPPGISGGPLLSGDSAAASGAQRPWSVGIPVAFGGGKDPGPVQGSEAGGLMEGGGGSTRECTLVLTEVPYEDAAEAAAGAAECCDVVVLAFDPTNEDSAARAIVLEGGLPASLPRQFVATRPAAAAVPDATAAQATQPLDRPGGGTAPGVAATKSAAWARVCAHCEKRELLPPLSAAPAGLRAGLQSPAPSSAALQTAEDGGPANSGGARPSPAAAALVGERVVGLALDPPPGTPHWRTNAAKQRARISRLRTLVCVAVGVCATWGAGQLLKRVLGEASVMGAVKRVLAGDWPTPGRPGAISRAAA